MSGKEGNVAEVGRQDRLVQEAIHDPYMMRAKPKEPTVCQECGVVFSNGRWQWLDDIPEDAHTDLCPACRRIRDRVPAGILVLSGPFLEEHQGEIMNLIHNKVKEQEENHPMKRLMDVREEEGNELVVYFTDDHLPRGVGDAIARAYDGELEVQFTEEAGLVRAYWHR